MYTYTNPTHAQISSNIMGFQGVYIQYKNNKQKGVKENYDYNNHFSMPIIRVVTLTGFEDISFKVT